MRKRTLILVLSILGSFTLLQSLHAESAKHAHAHEHDEQQLWCKEHSLPESECFICHPELRPQGRLWCNEHARFEDRCWLCHPELEDKEREYCTKHFLYLDECSQFHREAVATSKPKLSHDEHDQNAELYCTEHDLPEAECGLCHPELLEDLQRKETLKIRFPDAQSANLVGIETIVPEVSDFGESLKALGEIQFNQNRTVHLSAPVQGVIKEVYVDVGDTVGSEQKLLSIWSPNIGEAASEAILARQTLDRITRLRKKGISSAGELDRAKAKQRAALQQLKSLGFSADQLQSLGDDPAAPIMLTMTAPFGSEIITRHAVRGEYVETGKPLFILSDRSEVWGMLNVSEKQLGAVSVGQKVVISSRAYPEEKFQGKVTYISASIDHGTRMAVVRATIDNADGKLRENMFVEAIIELQSQGEAFLVPAGVIHNIDGQTVVFSKLSEDLFEVRRVTVGQSMGDRVQVLEGLDASQRLISKGSQAVKSHFLISRLGVGCVH